MFEIDTTIRSKKTFFICSITDENVISNKIHKYLRVFLIFLIFLRRGGQWLSLWVELITPPPVATGWARTN